jgi:hypothetical protein
LRGAHSQFKTPRRQHKSKRRSAYINQNTAAPTKLNTPQRPHKNKNAGNAHSQFNTPRLQHKSKRRYVCVKY